MPAPIASLWTGSDLRWIDRLSLASFVARGHPVTLYHAGDLKDARVDGVRLAHVTDVDPHAETLLQQVTPTVFADLFRLHMVERTGAIWVDTDVLCMREFVAQDGYLLGYESETTINNSVLGLPAHSPALALLQKQLNDPELFPEWLNHRYRKLAMEAAKGSETPLLDAAKAVPNVFGPLAVTWALTTTGESAHAHPKAALNPVHWSMADVYFNPHGGIDGWLDDRTIGVHLYASRIRAAHLRNGPFVGSFLHTFANEIGFDLGPNLTRYA